jgi:hypothetical protein
MGKFGDLQFEPPDRSTIHDSALSWIESPRCAPTPQTGSKLTYMRQCRTGCLQPLDTLHSTLSWRLPDAPPDPGRVLVKSMMSSFHLRLAGVTERAAGCSPGVKANLR